MSFCSECGIRSQTWTPISSLPGRTDAADAVTTCIKGMLAQMCCSRDCTADIASARALC